MGITSPPLRCILVFGGSFDPVHLGHVAIVKQFIHLLNADQLRLLPTGQSWQKTATKANATQRVTMLQLAFEDELSIPFSIDQQEIIRAEKNIPSYSVDSLRQIRAEIGNTCSLAFLIGADQLHNLPTWKNWRDLFDLTHIVVAARPGYTLNNADLPQELALLLQEKTGTKQDIQTSSCGKLLIEHDIDIDIAATHIRHSLNQTNQTNKAQQTIQVDAHLPNKVLNYIQQQHLYQ